ncbi:hypothetical protein QYE76_028965 [Lolium multiflorum]|uniref:F-box domain-containing protein n=1 Tax=Lolium multiflorum TaxID=4521 RepID=A0AAD8QPL2_LOLMU|nr:hypothetical protein QYE76_028965 [Lolium multiflorum]
MEIGHAAKPVREDRISKLDDAVLGHVLSFLPSKQAARAAALSSRWRDAFAGVHTVSIEEPEGSVPTYDDDRRRYSHDDSLPKDHDLPSRFGATITAAIVARHRSPAATPPLRALRVALHRCKYRDFVAVDQWISYALKQAGPALELDLRLRCLPIYCRRAHDDDDGVASPEHVGVPDPSLQLYMERFFLYTVPRGLFSSSTLRTLRIGPCRLSPPSAISLPSLVELLLSRVPDGEEDVGRLISACPRLADLTLESCDTVTALSFPDAPRLRRLVLRCCHNLANIVVDVSELRAFEYRGAVPEVSFMTMFGAKGWFLTMPSLTSCTVDICRGEVSAPEELSRLTGFLYQFASAKHLRLRSERLCPSIGDDAVTRLPTFRNLQHLELWGHLATDDDAADIVGVTSRILQHAPNLEVLSFVFETGTRTDADKDGPLPHGRYNCKEEELLDAHRLRYNRYDILDAPSGGARIPCLANRVREINLVHYQGGRVQRKLAKFLLCNACVMDELWCQFAEGPLWTQTELMREMKSWVTNKNANTVFR